MAEVTIEEVRFLLAQNIKRLRKQHGLPQERFALESGIDRTMLSKVERELTNPSLETLLKLANRLDVPIAELLREN